MIKEKEHSIDAVVVSCIDYRFIEPVFTFLKKKGVKAFDLISLAGASRQRNAVKKQLFVSFTLHHPKKVILLQHEDDGAYGGSGKFTNQEEEFSAYKSDLYRLSGWINKRIRGKDFKIERYIVKLNGEVLEV